MFNIFSFFTGKLSRNSLADIALKAHKKEWKKRLNFIKKDVKLYAKQGKYEYIISDQLLRCTYNANRPWPEITEDIQKAFPDCQCVMFSPHIISGQGNTFCKISWKKT